MNAKTMNCHACGAGGSSVDPTCSHCGVRLATVSCPSCFTMLLLSWLSHH